MSKLRFEELEIYFIYGYVNYNPNNDKEYIDEAPYTWAPLYSSITGENKFYRRKIDKRTVSLQRIEEGIEWSLGEVDITTTDIHQKKGGAGVLTFKINVGVRDKEYNLNDLFNILNLLPRTSFASENNYTRILEADNQGDLDVLEKLSKVEGWEDYSDIFKLFATVLLSNHESWNELICPDKKNLYRYRENGIDPQVPHVLVYAKIERDRYEQNFLKKNNTHEFNKEIAGILGRWMKVQNIDQVNTDYYKYYPENDEVITRDGKFISRYRDSKSFILLSSLLTLDITSTYNYEVPAQLVTKNSILTYLQYSRLRIHHALWLNKALDSIVNTLKENKSEDIKTITLKEEINTLKIYFANHQNNPLAYMWDTVLGQEIPRLNFHQRIEDLENTIKSKMNLIDGIISNVMTIQSSRRYFGDE
ncbi:MAG: hypothetical protein JJ971_00455 [Balneolaceae bacterium]|nr:hypothetical protein [Balneolaceae bacterium]MBO6544842.1 hypothetical protein [Balneolaceae bacterium]MBO6646238.1 hypothetical protein [Balneolaceae bacterium]